MNNRRVDLLPVGGPETEEQQRLRFQVELEFVQCLANPNYLNFLAQRGYFKDQAFINYLKYLLYWKEPEYARYLKLNYMPREHNRRLGARKYHGFSNDYCQLTLDAVKKKETLTRKTADIQYPMCLHFLDLLQYEHFRRELVSAQCAKFIDDQQILLWQHYTRRRTRLLQTQAEHTQQPGGQQAPSAAITANGQGQAQKA